MKKNLLKTLIFIFAITTFNCVQAAEVFDAPQNTQVEAEELKSNIVINENNDEEKINDAKINIIKKH